MRTAPDQRCSKENKTWVVWTHEKKRGGGSAGNDKRLDSGRKEATEETPKKLAG